MARTIDSPEKTDNNISGQQYFQSFWHFPEEVLIAGTNVKSRLGGPEMMIVGFCEGGVPPDAIFSTGMIKWRNKDETIGQMPVYPKIMANISHKTAKEMGMYGETIPDFFYFKGLNDEKPANNGVAQAIVKYWSRKKEDFIHSVVSLAEIELVS
jgi:hypothetical protein